MSHAAMFLGNDSGPGHIAGALGVPTLILNGLSPGMPSEWSLFSGQDPAIWAPRRVLPAEALPFSM
jgi:ADP-heptose:LPS heptosyltransferase